MRPALSFSSVQFTNFKALENYKISLIHLNLLVGPNNCGKSTIIGAFRALEAALRRARAKNPEWMDGPKGPIYGYVMKKESLPISVANVHTDYSQDDSSVLFRLSNGSKLHLFFPKDGGCTFYPEIEGKHIKSTSAFRNNFPIFLTVVPILGPVENEEKLVEKDTVAQNLGTHRASRHFRNFWHYYPDGFNEFSELVKVSWPGMEIQRPELTDPFSRELVMFCKEKRIPRELYWAGYGFQIWCQLLTHISRSTESTLIVIDEPEVYLHPDVQRQLISILRDAGPDVLLATHSPEILGEADPSDILLVDKSKTQATRLRDIAGVQTALDQIGSLQNLTLTQLAKNRKLLFVEGTNDYRLLRKIGLKLKLPDLARGNSLTAIQSGGFSTWKKISHFASTLHKSFGNPFYIGAIFDRDYWPEEQIEEITKNVEKHLDLICFHSRKEIENYLLVPSALDRALAKQYAEKQRHGKPSKIIFESSSLILDRLSDSLRVETQSQILSRRLKYFERDAKDASTITQETITWFEKRWEKLETRIEIISGKQLLQAFRTYAQDNYGLTVTETRIIEEITEDELPNDAKQLAVKLNTFCKRT